MNNNYNEFRKEVGEVNKAKGIHDKIYSYNHSLSLIFSELYEAMEADRLGNRVDFVIFLNLLNLNSSRFDKINLDFEELHDILIQNKTKYIDIYNKHIKGTIEEEIADAYLRLFDLAYVANVDLYHIDKSKLKELTGEYITEDIIIIIEDVLKRSRKTQLSYLLNYIRQLSYKYNTFLMLHSRLKLDYNKLYINNKKKY